MFEKFRSNMSMNLIGGLVSLILIFGLIVCFIGYRSIIFAFENEYSNVTYHMADSATPFVNGDHLDDYLEGREMEEYARTQEMLDVLSEKLNVSLIYVIDVDTSDYGSFVSIFNSVNNSVGNTEYTRWELGYERDTTNAEYKLNYRQIYEGEVPYGTVFRLNPPEDQLPHITTMVPVKDSKGDVCALLCVQRPVSEMIGAIRPYLIFIVIGVFVMAGLISAIAARFLRKAIIRPVERVAAETDRFAKENTLGEPLGELSRYDVMKNLAGSIDSMETDMINYIENLKAVTAEQERLGAELSIAASIQQDALPDVFPAFPDRSEFDVYAMMDPAREVGGDFYNFFLVDDDHLALIIADVSGKGIPGCLTMMAVNILTEYEAMQGGSPAEVLASVNHTFYEHNRAEMFVTVWIGILEISTGKLTAANAGHEYPAICRKGSGFEVLKDKHGLVLGGMDGMKYKDYEIQLEPEDKLFVYTDGLPEATSSDMELFGMERMTDALNEVGKETPEGILKGVLERVNEFVGDAPQFDDLTMLCLEYKG
ncbi:MAG: PP2C family protein-serine/threonine phosphatase [Firmicutes bacterium]|nr:PP2C family protein-serine/threonine phosphatase [Bacillota bacterium]